MTLEREAKLLAPVGLDLPDLDNVRKGVTAQAPRRLTLEATYYDTADLRLARWGITLRHRTGEPGPRWTLKLPSGHTDSTLARAELTFPGPPTKVPGAARDLLRAHLRGAPLAPVAVLRTTRTAVDLSDRAGAPFAEVVDDLVEITRDGEPAGSFREVEVELRQQGPAADKLLRACTTRLGAAGCRAERPVPKLVRALGPAAEAPPEVEVIDLAPGSTAAGLVRHTIARSVVQLLAHDPGVRLGEDPEDVHQFRVATRRLRSDLRTFGFLLDDAWVDRLRAEMAWLGSVVGARRDADVLLTRLRAQAELLADADADAGSAAALVDRLETDRGQARAAMLKGLRSARYDRLVGDLVAASDHPDVAPDAAPSLERPARLLLPGLVRRPWRRLAAAVDALGEDPPDEALHRVRILAKRCRYAAEAVSPVVGVVKAHRFATAIAEVQTVLGDHQDAIVAEAWLRAASTPEHCLAAGELIGMQRAERDRLRRAWPAVWAAASAPRLRGWFDTSG